MVHEKVKLRYKSYGIGVVSKIRIKQSVETRILCVQSKGCSLSDGVEADLRCAFRFYI